MTHASLSQKTRQTIVTSLKKIMKQKPLSKITVSELCNDCSINRKTFYYHFKDIYDLVHWMLDQEASEVIKKYDLLADYEKAIYFLIDYIDKNNHILNCIYDDIGREGMKQLFLSDFHNSINILIAGIEKNMNIHIEPGYKQFLCNFYTNALSGIMIDWFLDRSSLTCEEMSHYISLTLRSSLTNTILAGMKELFPQSGNPNPA